MSVELKKKVLEYIMAENSPATAAQLIVEQGIPARFECEFWDYKEIIDESPLAWGELCRDVASFHNAYGGYLVIGVCDDFELVGFDGVIDQQKARQKFRHFFGVDVPLVVEVTDFNGKRIVSIFIPKRVGPTVVASRQGPMLPANKPLFAPGAVFFRAEDACQLIRDSDDLQFVASPRIHALQIGHAISSRTQSNLPDRSLICSKLIGRSDVKSELWIWLSDRLSRYRVVAGPGGFGKTSAAYYFAEDVSKSSANGFMQVLWMSAKRRQFSGAINDFIQLPKADLSFFDIESLLDALAQSLAISESEWLDALFDDKVEMLSYALGHIRSFIVLDDIDSLSPDEQRQVVQLVMQIGNGGSKFLLTTRNNFVAPDSSTTRMPGLSGDDFKNYVEVLSQRFGRTLSRRDVDQLERETQGSPLFAESVFRLMKLGSKFSEAIKLWEGKDGEAARAACFKREVFQLTFKGRRALFAMSRVDSASLPEICRFAELERVEVEQAIVELDQLFLCNSEEIAGEPRFHVQENLRRLLDEEKDELVPEHAAVERRVAALKKEATGAGKSRGKNAPTAAAIRQAMVQLGAGDYRDACATVDEALARASNSADLWMVKARCYVSLKPVDVEVVRSAFEKSYLYGKREPDLFERWIDFELTLGNSNAAVDVGSKGSEVSQLVGSSWSSLVAQAHLKRAEQRLRRGELDDAGQDFRAALKHSNAALRSAPMAARGSIKNSIERATEGSWSTLPAEGGIAGSVAVLRLVSDAMKYGDLRPIWTERAIVSLRGLTMQGASKPSSSAYESLRISVASISKELPRELSDRLWSLLESIDPN